VRRVIWTLKESGNAANSPGPQHLFVITQHNTPASGLTNGSTSYTLSARTLTTGTVAWSRPFTPQDASSGLSTATATEGPEGLAGNPDVVLVEFGGTQVFDAATGAPLWQTATDFDSDLPIPYWLLGNGDVFYISENVDSDGDSVEETSAVQTGTETWQQSTDPQLAACANINQTDSPVPNNVTTDGQDLREFWNRGFEQRNLTTGAEVTAAA
jgi:outer membrane protein assembly factor BamB